MAEFNPNETFEVTPYDPNWPLMFEEESASVEATIGENAVEIEHVGSTSVPGLSAKPIIDMLLAVESFLPLAEYERLLGPLGYHYQSLGPETDSEWLFFWKGVPRTHHLHIVEFATWQYHRHIIFRDYLRSHPDVAQRYEDVKRELAEAFKSDRPAYTRGKTAFIKSIIAYALEEMENPTLSALKEEADQAQSSPQKLE
jgi:GrpB-like predicted nucleotidyltransferase (UPF0157 family)